MLMLLDIMAQEDEARLKDSSKPVKLAAFRVLQQAGAAGMKAADVITQLKTQPEFADWDNGKTRYLRNVSPHRTVRLHDSRPC